MRFGNGYLSPLYACPRRRVIPMGVKWRKYDNLPFDEIPKEKRVKKRELAICQGGCNRYTAMNNMTYNLCSVCAKKWAYHGYECDVPNCDAVADGTVGFQVWTGDNKICCLPCYNMWRRMDYCHWDKFVEKRHLFFLRPASFVKALEDGIVQIVPKDERVSYKKEVAECHHCRKVKEIDSVKYQLCHACRIDLQLYGEVCGVCEKLDANYWDLNESLYVCKPCYQRKNKYKISSYHIYKTQIMTIKECQICKEPVSHTKQKGESKCSANIDHDHDTDITRGVICHFCNAIEGMIDKIDISAHAYATRLKAYLENPPLSKSWMQE